MNADSISIVIAEDDADDVYIFREALNATRYKHSVALVGTGRELLDLMLSEGAFQNQEKPKPDFLLLDINMPVMDGLDALEKLNRSGAMRGVPVYVITTSINPAHRARALALGAKFYSKPNSLHGFETIFHEIMDAIQ